MFLAIANLQHLSLEGLLGQM